MGIARAASSPIHAHRGMNVQRLRHRNVNQVRNLWWWGKSRRGWLSAEHEELEDRLRRHQALMLHRYTKAMKRRALWDRESTPFYPSKRGSTNWEREMSSTQSMNAKVEEPDSKSSRRGTPEQVFHQDFESFKRAVDHAIARDPVGTLFGRRLRSPISANNLSWTSWSWIFDPKDIKEPATEEPQKPVSSEKVNTTASTPTPVTSESQPSPTIAHTSSSSKTTTSVKSSRSIVFQDNSSITTEYIYDPISGRKIVKETTPVESQTPLSKSTKEVPVQKKVTPPPPTAPKTFFDVIFGEHGVNIPVKTYKPHKVYGYGDETQRSKVKKDLLKENFESSRKREYDDLRWRTLGNNIDSTNFNCEPWNNREANPVSIKEIESEEPAEKRIRTSEAPDEDAPLFAGTTYQDKPLEAKGDFLATEGFRARQGMTMTGLKDTSSAAPAPTQSAEKLQPSIDRPHSRATNISVKKFGSRLQPVIDRVESTSRLEQINSPWKRFNDILARDQKKAQDQSEDIDLLRPSDVRAASRTARVTKQELEDKKVQDRKDMEKDFDTLAREQNTTERIAKPASVPALATNNMTHVWKHIEKYPTGIIAKSVQRLGLTKPTEESVNLTSYSPRKDSIVARSTATVESTSQADLQLQALGKDLKAVYEQERGKIDNEVKTHSQEAKSVPRFSEPTVKPGVVRDLAIEQHTQVFEPEYAKIVDGAKQVRRELLSIRSALEIVNQNKVASVREDAKSVSEHETVGQATKSQVNASPLDETSPYVLLKLSRDGDWVLPTYYQSSDQITDFSTMSSSKNIVSAIRQLPSPNSFVQWFGELDKKGYVLSKHSTDSLLFYKPNTAQKVGQRLRNRIAAQEAASQPAQQAANVLEEIPTSVPNPAPSAPTAPTMSSAIEQSPSTETAVSVEEEIAAKPRRKPKSGTRMTRQEPVFSGQQRLKPQTTNLPDPEHFQKQNPSTSFTRARRTAEQEEPQPGFFKRVSRFIRRVFLTGLAFGAGAYSIGVIAEALQGRAQIAAGESGGPMKRLVLEDRVKKERQRNGIYSTESSR